MRLARIALLSLSLAGITGAGIAVASPPGQGYAIVYYDEAGEVVGGALANPCTGNYGSWGIQTDIFTKKVLYCEP